jgi:hypothetical protein
MWFELHLLKQSYVSIDQLIEAVKRHQLNRVPIGRLAIVKGRMTVAQVFQVLRTQADRDVPFGRLAVEMGFLTELELAHLLMVQSDETPSLSDILVEMGAIDRELLDAERQVFRREAIGNWEACAGNEILV